ncbi:MAG: phosphodiester glycosidase family protein, partial [Coleofasciculus sp. C2-GNP5-27]
ENQPVIQVETNQTQTTIGVSIPDGLQLHVFSLPNPNRLVVELRPNAMVEKDILWAPGIWWRQRTVTLGDTRFPLVWLEVDPKNPQVNLKPIWSNPTTQVGTAPLIKTAQLWKAAAAINGGFFNRNNQLPLGAIRRDGRWYSGPILNRGAIAWTDQHQFKFGRLSLEETLITANGERFPILFLNSGYVQAGISRYTPEWGALYTPLTDNEVILVVQNNQITAQLPAGVAGEESFFIPVNGYLLTHRGSDPRVTANSLTIGTKVQIEQKTLPTEFNNYPHILGAGPLLLQNRQIVLDAQAEKFSDAFAQQSAIRSAIGITANGTLIIAAMHNRVGGKGPN